MEKQSSLPMTILGILLALGMSCAAYILGFQAKQAASGQQSITVKGLAVKDVLADGAEWTITLAVKEATFAQALAKLRAERPALDAFLNKEGLDKATWQEGGETVTAHMETIYLENGGTKTEQQGYDATQNVVISNKDLAKIENANKDFLALQAEGHPFTAMAPLYLVSNLEDIKMSLIAAATENARKRAEEFVKQDQIKVGVMRSASQGSFYILAAGGNSDVEDYGGVYDKTTIKKLAKVVVTIVYNIEQ